MKWRIVCTADDRSILVHSDEEDEAAARKDAEAKVLRDLRMTARAKSAERVEA